MVMVIALVIVTLVIMQISTNPILNEMEQAFYCPDYYIERGIYEFEGYSRYPDMNYIVYDYDSNEPNLFAQYNMTRCLSGRHMEDVDIDLKLYRIFALHNFDRGYLWINYSVEVADEDGTVITGSWRINVRMDIQRVNGEWTVTRIYERP